MRNPYREGSDAWSLFDAGEHLAERQREDFEGQDAAIDRHTIALYRVGAALISSFATIAEQLASFSQATSSRRARSASEAADERSLS